MNDFILFWKSASLINRLKIIRTILEIPGLIFHELCHIIFIVIFMRKITSIKFIYFYKVDKKTNILNTYKFSISHTGYSNLLFISIISIAPVLGIIFALFIIKIFPYLFIYLILSYKTTFLSNEDFLLIQDILIWFKLSKNKIKKIKRILVSSPNV